jgi:hypothetical protein
MKLLGIINVGFDVTDQLLTRFSALIRWEYNETEYQLFIDFNKAYDSMRRKVFYNILIDFVVSMKLVRMSKICLNETHSKFHIGEHLYNSFLIQNDLKQGDALAPLLLNFNLEYAIRKVEANQVGRKLNRHISFCLMLRT